MTRTKQGNKSKKDAGGNTPTRTKAAGLRPTKNKKSASKPKKPKSSPRVSSAEKEKKEKKKKKKSKDKKPNKAAVQKLDEAFTIRSGVFESLKHKKKSSSTGSSKKKKNNNPSLVGPIRFPEQAKFFLPGATAVDTTRSAGHSHANGTPVSRYANRPGYNNNYYDRMGHRDFNNNNNNRGPRWGGPTSSLSSYNNNNGGGYNNNNGGTYNGGGGKRKRPKFQLKMPSAQAGNLLLNGEQMPWHECVDEYWSGATDDDDDDDNTDVTTKKSSGGHVLPTDFFASEALQHLTNELESFASYVRLQPKEHAAREHVIQCITDLAGSTYPQCADVHIQCFGSYATPQVCTFLSDVDMALWGVVESPTLTTTFPQNDDAQASHGVSTTTTKTTKSAGSDTKLQKWRDLLQEFADQQEEEREERKEAGKDTDTPTSKNTVSRVSVKHDDDDDEEEKKDETLVEKEASRKPKTSAAVLEFELDTEGVVELGAPQALFVLDRAGDSDDAIEVISIGDTTTDSKEGTTVDETSSEKLTGESIKESSDDDSADKMENLGKGSSRGVATFAAVYHGAESDSSEDSEEVAERPKKRLRRLADCLSSSDENEEEEHVLTSSDGLEVSYHANHRKPPATPAVVGPVGKTRNLVVRALRSLGNGLRKNRIIVNVEVRHRARVPIVCMETRLGFEGDVAIGGHNGTDTSSYASGLVKKYKSFATVVLFLKIILNQQDLDKPFTGGLGSYKLYALVSHHLKKHLALGGKDEAGEVFASFLYRFGGDGSSLRSNKVSRQCQSVLEKEYPLDCHDAVIDLKPCHLLEHVVELFETSWKRLSKRLASKDKPVSFLVELIRHNSLQSQRAATIQRASSLSNYSQHQRSGNDALTRSRSFAGRDRRHDGHSFARTQQTSNYTDLRRGAAPRQSTSGLQALGSGKSPTEREKPVVSQPLAATSIERAKPRDAEEQELLRGYGVKRNQNGALIPRSRPHVEKKQSGVDKRVVEGWKNGLSKKKQHRDKGLKGVSNECA